MDSLEDALEQMMKEKEAEFDVLISTAFTTAMTAQLFLMMLVQNTRNAEEAEETGNTLIGSIVNEVKKQIIATEPELGSDPEFNKTIETSFKKVTDAYYELVNLSVTYHKQKEEKENSDSE